jgi:hypothetical protein
MKSLDDKVREDVLQAVEHTKKGGDLVLFWEAYQTKGLDLIPIVLDYMSVYQNVMVKFPLLSLSEKHKQTMAQMNNLYKSKLDKYVEIKK